MRGLYKVFVAIGLFGLCLSGAGTARAEGDLLGFYTTTDGEGATHLYTDAPMQSVEVHLLLLDASLGGVSGWEARIDIDGDVFEDGVGDYLAPTWDLKGGLNVADSAAGLFNVGLGLGALALRADPNGAVHLATFSCFVIDTDSAFGLRIGPYPGSVTFPFDTGPGYVDPDDVTAIRSMTVARNPAFTFNYRPLVEAGFTADPETDYAPCETRFRNTVIGPAETYSWNFGDGRTSDLRNPLHVYTAPGSYEVSLVVDGPENSDTATATIQVEDPTVVADFDVHYDGSYTPATLYFPNRSSGEIIYSYWEFGDGAISSLSDGVHTYTSGGSFEVTLTVTGTVNTDSITRTVNILDSTVVADFTVAPDTLWSDAPVFFSDTSTGPVMSRYWRLGDSGYSTLANPYHIYRTPGDYEISLTVFGPGEPDTTTQTITVIDSRVTSIFTADPYIGPAPLEVNFSNASTGAIRGFDWDFGDGVTSTEASPTHTYDFPGEYVVTLTVSGPALSHASAKTIYVSGDPIAPAILGWSPAPGFIEDGVSPDQGPPGTIFEFRVVYSQSENIPPATGFPKLMLDGNGDGDSDDFGEGAHYMFPVDENAFNLGREYRCFLELYALADYRYRCEAFSMGGQPAEGAPALWTEGPVVEIVAAPDLAINPEQVVVQPLTWPFGLGSPVLLGAPAVNLGGVAATALMRFSYLDTYDTPQTLIEFPIVIDGAGGETDHLYFQFLWIATQEDVLFHFDIVDVQPADIDPGNNHAQYYLSDSPLGLLVRDFQASSGDDGVRLRWSASSEVLSFEIESRRAGQTAWTRITPAPILADAASGVREYDFLDASAEAGSRIAYRLMGETAESPLMSLGTLDVEHLRSLPEAVSLSQNYPNPFNPSTNIDLRLPQAGPVDVGVYDTGGRLVRRLAGGSLPAGVHVLTWDGTDRGGGRVASGTYFCRLTTTSCTRTVKLLLLK